RAGVIPAKVKFQISLPTPIAPTYNNMMPADRPKVLPPLTQHFVGEVARIAGALPNDRIALQWDVCQEVLAWEGYYEPGPVDFRTETVAAPTKVGDAVPAAIELGYHLAGAARCACPRRGARRLRENRPKCAHGQKSEARAI